MKTAKTFLIGMVVTAMFILFGLWAASPARPQGYASMFEAVDWLARKYGVIVYTTHEPLPYTTYARSYADVIVFNSIYVEDPALLRTNMTADVASGYHTGLHCTPEQALAAHEFAHTLDYLTGYTAEHELEVALANGELAGEVSGYSVTSVNEALAEAFTAVECDVPSAAETAIYNMLVT